MPTQAEATAALVDSYRAVEARRAAAVAALVAAYWRSRVDVEDSASVERWLALMVPRILAENDASATRSIAYGNMLRSLELPGSKDAFKFEKASVPLTEEQVRVSLMVTGVRTYQNKMREFGSPMKRTFETNSDGEAITVLAPDVGLRDAYSADVKDVAARKVAGATSRHVMNGGRQSIYESVKADPKALGYVRVTKPDPCFFCAMLASRGLVYTHDSFDESDARFTGDGNVKVHDSCSCALKPAYRRDDPMLDRSKEFRKLWDATGSLLDFRQAYEGRAS